MNAVEIVAIALGVAVLITLIGVAVGRSFKRAKEVWDELHDEFNDDTRSADRKPRSDDQQWPPNGHNH